MNRITLTEKDKEFYSSFAAPSVLTGFFCAEILGTTREEIEEAFTEPGPILVHNLEDLYADKIYEGYRRINEIRENGENFVIILDREAPDDGLREAD